MIKNIATLIKRVSLLSLLAIALAPVLPAVAQVSPPPENPQRGSIGVQGTISSPPPTTGASISIPRNGQTFTSLPVTVSGICPNGLLVKLFKNNVFAGSVQCTNGSFSILIDLFDGQNDLVARVYDALDQAGPDSATTAVNYSNPQSGGTSRVSLSSNFAKRGANPGQILTWPIILSGGQGPYAISIDWGDGTPADLKSQAFAGTVDIEHKYASAGVYNVIVKTTDANGGVAYLQLVGVANGPLSQTDASKAAGDSPSTVTQTKIIWWPAAVLIPLIFLTFWLGRKHQLHVLRKRIERGERPF